MHLLLYLLAIALFPLNVADWHLTALILTTRNGKEENPIMAWLIARLGIDWALGAKVALVSAAALFMAIVAGPVSPILTLLTLLAANALYVWVVIHNWRQLRA